MPRKGHYTLAISINDGGSKQTQIGGSMQRIDMAISYGLVAVAVIIFVILVGVIS
jgi:hypothetical protein